MARASVIRLAGASLNQLPLDWQGNTARILAVIEQAKAQGVSLLCLPELCLSGYGCEDMFLHLDTIKRSEECLLRVMAACEGIAVLVGLPVYFQGAVYNCAALIQDTKLLGLNPKKFLPREGIHYEERWFKPWPFGEQHTIDIAGVQVPIGDQSYAFPNARVAIEICEEAWGAKPAAADHADDGAEIVLNASASCFSLGKGDTRETLVRDNSRAMRVFYVYTNLLGLEAGRAIYDGSIFIAHNGKILHEATRFLFGESKLLVGDVNLDEARHEKLKNRAVSYQDRRQQQALPVVKGLKELRGIGEKIPVARAAVTKAPSLTANEEFLLATTLALADYMRKAKARGFVISLSGGCDSSTLAVLVAHMMARLLKELGPDGAAAYLGVAKPATGADDVKSWLRQILTLVYQATAQSSQTTREAAAALANELGATFYEAEVEDIVKAYTQRVSQMIDRPLTWQEDDLALQNIQARVRAPLAWLIANVKGALLLTTSNRSEAAVGYATMDGDMAGGLAPIAGVSKHFLRAWLRWAETQHSYGMGPLPSLSFVNHLAPTAELRPGGEQTDEADLMPYVVMERIEQLFMRERLSPADMVERLQDEFPELAPAMPGYVKTFLELWRRNQWKRERMAPGFHLDEPNFDPKSWCRYPILSGSLF